MLGWSRAERTIVAEKPLNQRNAFEDDELVWMCVVIGQQVAKENLLKKIDNASRGLEASKRLWILPGPPGAAKSRSMDGIKTALNIYSYSVEGKTYVLLLPTVDEQYLRIEEKDVFCKEPSDAIASVSHSVLLADEPSYQTAIGRYIFENEFKSSENIKLLGWIKSGSSAAGVRSKKQEQPNETGQVPDGELGLLPQVRVLGAHHYRELDQHPRFTGRTE
jgi:hypothetical protein